MYAARGADSWVASQQGSFSYLVVFQANIVLRIIMPEIGSGLFGQLLSVLEINKCFIGEQTKLFNFYPGPFFG